MPDLAAIEAATAQRRRGDRRGFTRGVEMLGTPSPPSEAEGANRRTTAASFQVGKLRKDCQSGKIEKLVIQFPLSRLALHPRCSDVDLSMDRMPEASIVIRIGGLKNLPNPPALARDAQQKRHLTLGRCLILNPYRSPLAPLISASIRRSASVSCSNTGASPRRGALRLATSDFPNVNTLGITIAGQPLGHLLYHFTLTYSNWESGSICFSESFAALSRGCQEALWRRRRVMRS